MKFLILCLIAAMSHECLALEMRRVSTCSGVVLRMRGDITDGDYARVRSQFYKNEIVGIDLGSDGGDLEDGVRIANLIRRKGVIVYVSSDCSSVCAFIFFAGVKRYLAGSARIGVHSASNDRDIEDTGSMRLTLTLARNAAKFGVPDAAVGKMVTTSPANISYLDKSDLAALGVLKGDPFLPPCATSFVKLIERR